MSDSKIFAYALLALFSSVIKFMSSMTFLLIAVKLWIKGERSEENKRLKNARKYFKLAFSGNLTMAHV